MHLAALARRDDIEALAKRLAATLYPTATVGSQRQIS
jgi:hypothetical protein